MRMKLNSVTLSRLRIAQRCLVAASDLDPELLVDPYWQKAMISTSSLLAKGDAHAPAKNIRVIKQLQNVSHK